jgi:hypothetical protein
MCDIWHCRLCNILWNGIIGIADYAIYFGPSIKILGFWMSLLKVFLFYGPPESREEILAKAITNKFLAKLISVKCLDILTLWFVESEPNVYDVFW